MPTLPPYIHYPSDMVMRAPLQLDNADMYGFFVKGDEAKIQAMVDARLNTAAMGQLQFDVLSPYLMLTFTTIHHAYSSNPIDKQEGWGQETDIVFWALVGELDAKGNVQDLYWYPAYVWIDHPMALITGREVFGYPKYQCQFQMPNSPKNADLFSVDINAFKTFSPETKAQMQRLLTLTLTDPVDEPFEELESGLRMVKAIIKLIGTNELFSKLSWSLIKQIFAMIKSESLPQLFLKQLPDGLGDKAVYQALTVAPAKVKKVHQMGLLQGGYTLNVEAFASEPIVETLGLQLGDQPVNLGFWLNMDFEVPYAKEIFNSVEFYQRRKKEKIAILGGGVSSCAAAFAITSQPNWQDNYELTLYQLGWRIGGKGASGRNAKMGDRIEEHGLHIWFGFYENAFKVMRECYAELNRPQGAPLQHWNDAFKPHNYVVLEEKINQVWESWAIDFPTKSGTPGNGDGVLDLWDLATTMTAWLAKLLKEAVLEVHRIRQQERGEVKPTLWGRIKDLFDGDDEQDEAQHALQHLQKRHQAHQADHKDQSLLERIADDLFESVDELLIDHDELRHLYVLMDFGFTVLKGMYRDGVFKHGFDCINQYDFREWLTLHGANLQYTVDCAPVRGLYDLVFAYEDGDFNKPNLEAGTALRGALRIVFCYQGSIMYKMQAGMGDVVFTPFYQVLKNRGVKFEYFNKVDELLPDATGTKIEQIKITQQVALKNPASEYAPLLPVKGLACWPSEPLYEQIDSQQAALLQQHHINLESYWSDWPQLYQQAFNKPLPQKVLRLGHEFDAVIFGISIGAIEHLMPKVLAYSLPLQHCVAKVKTVCTQAYQVWTKPDLPQLGWNLYGEGEQQPVLTGYVEPFDTWAAMNQLLIRESWPKDNEPHNCAYFCSAMPVPTANGEFPPFSDHQFPNQATEYAYQNALTHWQKHVPTLWPQLNATPDAIWSDLHVTQPTQGEARFKQQYWRGNIDPSERYVLSVKGSTQYRLATDATGFSNLYITGDWLKSGINAGCVEQAVMAGLSTSRAICGQPRIILGEFDFTGH